MARDHRYPIFSRNILAGIVGHRGGGGRHNDRAQRDAGRELETVFVRTQRDCVSHGEVLCENACEVAAWRRKGGAPNACKYHKDAQPSQIDIYICSPFRGG